MGFKEIDDTGFVFLPQRLFLHSLCMCVCVCTCVVVHGCVYAHACKCVWRSEVAVSLLFSPLFLRLNLELMSRTRRAGRALQRSRCFRPLHFVSFIPRVLGLKHRSPCLHHKPFTEWATLRLPILCFLMLI